MVKNKTSGCRPAIIKPGIKAVMILIFSLAIFSQVNAQKTDNIRLVNGNVITGEVKKLEYGKLSFNTDDLGLLSVNWEKVVMIESTKIFEIETMQGYLFIGTMEKMVDTGMVFIRAGAAGTEVRLSEITSIYSIKSRFFQRISGPVSITFGYSKSSDLLQLAFNTDLDYRGTRIFSELSSSSAYTKQYDTLITQRQQYSFSAGKNFRKHWFTGGLVGYEQNSELGIQSRITLGALSGKTFIQNNSNDLSSYLAIQGTREYFYSDEPPVLSLELLFDIKYKHYLYYTPKSSITSEFQVIPNLTDLGRIRINFSIDLSQEIFKDFKWTLNFYANYDNRPPDENATKNDWGITTGLGYTF